MDIFFRLQRYGQHIQLKPKRSIQNFLVLTSSPTIPIVPTAYVERVGYFRTKPKFLFLSIKILFVCSSLT
jgi:hypothetical protein